MPEVSVYENERGYVDFTLTYSQQWSDATKRGLPVQQADVTNVYFYVKTNPTDASPLLSLSDASSSQIQWTGATTGKIRVKFGTSTNGKTGDGKYYELRVKFPDGSYVTAESGRINIIPSVVETP